MKVYTHRKGSQQNSLKRLKCKVTSHISQKTFGFNKTTNLPIPFDAYL